MAFECSRSPQAIIVTSAIAHSGSIAFLSLLSPFSPRLARKRACCGGRRIIQDFEKFPELRLLNKYHRVPAILFGAAVFAAGGYPVFLWGFVVSTVLLWHGTFSINSLTHFWGSRPFETGDQSRNNLFLALITLGEGWHNNHHQFMSSARQGLRWWEIDITYYALRTLSLFGIVRELRVPNPSAIFKVRTAIGIGDS